MNARSLAAAIGVLLVACDGPPLPTTAAPGTEAATSVSAAAAENRSPSASASAHWGQRMEGWELEFSGAASRDPNRKDELTYSWNFGDGSSGSGRKPTHVYADNGRYNVSLTVTDNHGASATASLPLTIGNVTPRPGSLSVPSNVVEGDSFVISLDNPTDTSSVDQGEGFHYSFDCGSSVWSAWQSSPTYLCPGRNNDGVAYLYGRVRDKDQGIGTSRRQALQVANKPPVILRADAVRRGPKKFDVVVKFTDAPGDRFATVKVVWDADNATTRPYVEQGKDETFGWEYVTAYKGKHKIKITVTDKNGESETTEVEVELQ